MDTENWSNHSLESGRSVRLFRRKSTWSVCQSKNSDVSKSIHEKSTQFVCLNRIPNKLQLYLKNLINYPTTIAKTSAFGATATETKSARFRSSSGFCMSKYGSWPSVYFMSVFQTRNVPSLETDTIRDESWLKSKSFTPDEWPCKKNNSTLQTGIIWSLMMYCSILPWGRKPVLHPESHHCVRTKPPKPERRVWNPNRPRNGHKEKFLPDNYCRGLCPKLSARCPSGPKPQ